MGFWNKLKGLFAREAADVKEVLTDAGRALDDALAKKERELEASPEERVDMILEEIEADDAEFDALEQRIRGGLPDDSGEDQA